MCRSNISREFQSAEPVNGVKIMANINIHNNIENAVRVNAEGIGLYRTEFEFFSQGKLLSEDEQFKIYTHVIKAISSGPVYFRTLDVGGDKTADFFNIKEEANPYLGLRGSRLLLKRHDLFRPQARAFARASEFGPVYIMYPMIIDIKQFNDLKNLFSELTSDIKTGKIFHGVMFEVPSACLQAEKITEAADFACIGTNDLIQYLFAVDRNNVNVAFDYNPEREVFWQIVKTVSNAAVKSNCPLSVCGEIAGNTDYIKMFLLQLKRMGKVFDLFLHKNF